MLAIHEALDFHSYYCSVRKQIQNVSSLSPHQPSRLVTHVASRRQLVIETAQPSPRNLFSTSLFSSQFMFQELQCVCRKEMPGVLWKSTTSLRCNVMVHRGIRLDIFIRTWNGRPELGVYLPNGFEIFSNMPFGSSNGYL